MSRSINIVTNALEYYDKNTEYYDKILSKIKYYKLKIVESDLNHSSIIFYDKNKKKLFSSRYEIIGMYNKMSSTWVWAWSVPYFNKNATYISKKILNYGLDIPPKPENKFLKSELITSRFRISSTIQLDLHVSIASYISKNPMVYKLKYLPVFKAGELREVGDPDIKETSDYVLMYLFLLDSDVFNSNKKSKSKSK